ncbi:hypothetical protein A2Z10_02110 [Candidatus Azambacteria bacterium RBG_16_47_10]|uniref:DUF5671 domain-containing protein n=1 Tax=Candidatus Azambacteria bacterium RBG_16_47_10 TaxID=1797292 RepID=A0A1F5B0J2_9BACT|nr:MAG: hypothetical protein A2Z10_02110 [Candidatus Azambacteria bacterium RBG_16_47_10]
MFKKNTLIRIIYLYTFSLVGLVLVVIGGVRFVDMGLKAWVFTQADEEQRMWQKQPPMPVITEKRVETAVKEGKIENLTEDEKMAMEQWLISYGTWKEQQEKFDPITSQRQREAAGALSFILVGLPLYLYHWRIIKREKNEEANGGEEVRG